MLQTPANNILFKEHFQWTASLRRLGLQEHHCKKRLQEHHCKTRIVSCPNKSVKSKEQKLKLTLQKEGRVLQQTDK